jgi:hypothetical protein
MSPAIGSFHHLGYACKRLGSEVSFFELQGYKKEGSNFEDEDQGVRGCFMVSENSPRIELLENLEGSDTLTPWINMGMGVYHFAYEVENIFAALEEAKKNRAIVVVEPKPAIAFQFRKIAFVMYRNFRLVEFIESKTLK